MKAQQFKPYPKSDFLAKGANAINCAKYHDTVWLNSGNPSIDRSHKYNPKKKRKTR
jgi:hypothetical protein